MLFTARGSLGLSHCPMSPLSCLLHLLLTIISIQHPSACLLSYPFSILWDQSWYVYILYHSWEISSLILLLQNKRDAWRPIFSTKVVDCSKPPTRIYFSDLLGYCMILRDDDKRRDLLLFASRLMSIYYKWKERPIQPSSGWSMALTVAVAIVHS